MLKRIKQFFCLHWFDPATVHEYSVYGTTIICTQVRVWNVKVLERTCCRCDLKDSREVSRTYKGWS